MKQKDARFLRVNHYKGLTIADILGFCKGKKDFEKYLPDERDVPMLPRDYVLSLAISIVGEPFRDWVKGKVDVRHQEWLKKNDQAVELTKEAKTAILACRKASGKLPNKKGPHLTINLV